MAKRTPQHRTEPQTVWTLARIVKGQKTTVGQYSTEAKAVSQAERIITTEANARSIRGLAWTPLPFGGKELIYGRDEKSWRFVLEPWTVDGEAA